MAFTRRRNCREDAVRCKDEKPGRRVVREGLDNLLRRPSRGRGVGHVEMYDSAAVMEEDYEHVEQRNIAVGTTKKSTETRSAT